MPQAFTWGSKREYVGGVGVSSPRRQATAHDGVNHLSQAAPPIGMIGKLQVGN